MKDNLTEKYLLNPDHLLLYRAARRGIYGRCFAFEQGSITDALFVYLDGKPDRESAEVLEAEFMGRPWACVTNEWNEFIRKRYPRAEVYRRYMMKPAKQFRLPEASALPEGYCLSRMDADAFARHPFSHGSNYPDYTAFRTKGSGSVIRRGGEIVASASSFLSLDGEVELDLYTREDHRGNGLAGACAADMLRDCMERGITVHWDAQNEPSRHLAEKFGFEIETRYSVYRQENKPGLFFEKKSIDSPDAQGLLRELNETLTGILGHNGMAHVCFDDFSHEKAFFLVGYDEGVPVCCAGIRRMDETTGEIKRVYARKNRRGIGTALMAALEKFAADAGYRRLVLECREGNARAIGFYQKAGYTICEKYPPYGEETDAICMEKQLGQGRMTAAYTEMHPLNRQLFYENTMN